MHSNLLPNRLQIAIYSLRITINSFLEKFLSYCKIRHRVNENLHKRYNNNNTVTRFFFHYFVDIKILFFKHLFHFSRSEKIITKLSLEQFHTCLNIYKFKFHEYKRYLFRANLWSNFILENQNARPFVRAWIIQNPITHPRRTG